MTGHALETEELAEENDLPSPDVKILVRMTPTVIPVLEGLRLKDSLRNFDISAGRLIRAQGRQLVGESELRKSINMIESGPSIRTILQEDVVHLWHKAIDSEVASLHCYYMFYLSVDCGELISIKFLLVKKQNNCGMIERYKARLVTQGFFQQPVFDFNAESTYAPTVDLSVLGLLLAKAANEN